MLFKNNKDVLEKQAKPMYKHNEETQNDVNIENLKEYYTGFLAEFTAKTRAMLNGIIGFAELLVNEQLTDTQNDYANEIYNTSLQLASLIENTFELSTLKSGTQKLERRSFSLEWFLHEMYTMAHTIAKDRGLEFIVKIDTPLPSELCTDITKLRECLERLLFNAITYTVDGMIVLRIAMHDDENTIIQFDIIDSGIGIPEERQGDIFKPFKQLIDSEIETYTKNGLGLTISQGIAELLGGDIIVASQPGAGSIFSVQIPTGVDFEKQTKLKNISLKTHDHFRKEQKSEYKFKHTGKILYADDDNISRSIVTLLLETFGVQTVAVNNGEKAIEKAKNENFDLIMLDLEMPVMDGYEAAKKLVELDFKNPVIALTANVKSEDNLRDLQQNFDEVIIKPVDRKKLQEILIKYLPVTK